MFTIRYLSNQSYEDVWHAMREFTDARTAETTDEIWVVEHPPVYTLGQNGKREHILNPGNIAIIETDRGGQVTYHGPGQLVLYVLFDIDRRQMGVRKLVSFLEQSVIALLEDLGIAGQARCDAPGVYVDGAKICSIGLRIRHGRSYHGLAFNINMDLSPFLGINPCGYAQLKMTQLKDLGVETTPELIAPLLIAHLQAKLGYTCQPNCQETVQQS